MRISALALLGLLLIAPPPQQDDERVRRIFQEAERLLQDGDREGALRQYEMLVSGFGTSGLADDALLRAAETYWVMGNVDAASQAITRLQRDYQGTPGAAGAYVLEGNIREATANGPDDLEEALAAFRNVVLLYDRQTFPDLEWRAAALVRAGQISVLLGEPDDAQAAFLAAIEDEPRSVWTAHAQLRLATSLLRSGEWVSAAEILQDVVAENDAGSDSPPDAVAAAARRRLELGYRMLLRPALGQNPWSGARRMRLSGPQLKDPIGVDAGEDRRVIVVDEGLPRVLVYSPEGVVLHDRRASDLGHPFWDQHGVPFAATKEALLSASTREREVFSVPSGDNEPKPLKEIVAGVRGIYRQWLVLDSDGDRVLVFDEDNRYRSALVADNQSEPVDLDVDYLGRLYVLDRRAKSVVRFGADTGARADLVQRRDWRRPEAVAVGELGHVFVLDRDAKKVEIFNSAGRLVWELGPDLYGIELRSPRDIGVDGAGRIYIADRNLKTILVVE